MKISIFLMAIFLGLSTLTACGATPAPTKPEAKITVGELTLTYKETPEATSKILTIDCSDDKTLCKTLLKESAHPTKDPMACTQIYGGPATVNIVGKINRKPIALAYSRTNGCDIARWESMDKLIERYHPEFAMVPGLQK